MNEAVKNFKTMLNNRYIKFTISFAFCISFIFFIFVLRRVSLIGDGDSFNQLYPAFVYVGQYIRELFGGNFQMYDFCIGFGEDVIMTLNSYGLGDFLSLLSVFVPIKFSEQIYNIVMLIKIYLCGITFMLYAKRYIKDGTIIVCGALLYSLSTYSLFRGMGFWMFLNPMFLFPLILCGIDEVCTEEKDISYILVFGVLWQTLCGFYYLYINIILTVIYFFVGMLIREKGCAVSDFIKKLWSKGTKIAIQSLLGIGIGAVFFIPGVIGYFNSSRTERETVFTNLGECLFYNRDFYFNNFKNLLIPNIWESVSTISTIVLLAVLVGAVSKKCNNYFKAISLVFIILYNIPFFGSVMNGFSDVSDRWYYAIPLFLVMLTCETIEKEIKAPGTIKGIFVLLGLTTLVLDTLTNGGKTVIILRNVGLFLCILITVYIFDSEMRQKLLLPYVCLLLIINGIFIFGPNEFGGYGYSWAFTPKGEVLSDMEKSIRDIQENKEFERVDVYGASLASSLVMDYCGTSEYFSILNNHISEFYQELAISPGLRSASWILKGIDGREEIMSMLSVSQYLDFTTEGATINSSIKENEYYLPLGFTYDKWMKREKFNQLDSLQKQEVMLKSVVLEEKSDKCEEIFETQENKTIPYNLEYRNVDVDKNRLATKSGSLIRVYVETEQDSLYISFEDFLVQNAGVHEIIVGNKNLQLRNQYDGYYMGIDDFWVNVTELKEEDNLKYFDVLFLEDCEFSLKGIAIYEHTQDVSIYEERKEDVLENVVWNNNEISGRIVVQKPKILFMSIPYSKGWKAYIGEDEVEILQANVGFSAIELPKGEHEIKFKYETPGIREGVLCSIGAILMLVFLNRKAKAKREHQAIRGVK